MRSSQSGNTPSGMQIQELLQKQTSRFIGERVAAKLELERLGPEAVEVLLEFLREEAKRREQKRRLFRFLLTGGVILAILLATVLIAIGHPELLGLLGAFGAMGGLSTLLMPSPKQVAAIQALARMKDPRALGPLIEGLTFPDLNIQQACAEALIHITPGIQAEDSANLLPLHFQALQKVLKNRDWNVEPELLKMLLDLLRRLEDVSALPIVEKMKNTEAATEAERSVREAARQTYEVLVVCQVKLQTAQVLLRASEMPAASPETLLRAAQPADSTTDPQQLLRATTGNDV